MTAKPWSFKGKDWFVWRRRFWMVSGYGIVLDHALRVTLNFGSLLCPGNVRNFRPTLLQDAPSQPKSNSLLYLIVNAIQSPEDIPNPLSQWSASQSQSNSAADTLKSSQPVAPLDPIRLSYLTKSTASASISAWPAVSFLSTPTASPTLRSSIS